MTLDFAKRTCLTAKSRDEAIKCISDSLHEAQYYHRRRSSRSKPPRVITVFAQIEPIGGGDALAGLLPPENAIIEDVARHVGVQPEALARWRDQAAAGAGEQVTWAAAARFDAVLVTTAVDEAAKSTWCRTNGLHVQELVDWRKAATEALRDPRRLPARPSPSRGGTNAAF
jgi:hypothetical protein